MKGPLFMKTISKLQLFGFSLLEISYWCFNASFISFLVSYLLSKNVSNSILSILLSTYLLAAFCGSLVCGALCDHLISNRTVIIVCLIITGIIMYLIYFLAPSIPALAILYPLLGFISQPQASNIDSWVLLSCRNNISIYGKIRCTPSIFFAFVSFILGNLISLNGYYFMLIFATFFLIVGTFTAIFLPPVSDRLSKPNNNAKKTFNINTLFICKPYVFLIILLLFIGIATSPLCNLKASILAEVGGTVTSLGIDSFIAAITQVPFLAFAPKMKHLPLRYRYICICSFHLSTLLLAIFAISPAIIFISTFFYNAAYGIMLPTMREVTESNVPFNCRNLGHNIADAVYNSFSGIISLLYSGRIIDIYGSKCLLFICIFIICIPLIINAVLYRNYNRI